MSFRGSSLRAIVLVAFLTGLLADFLAATFAGALAGTFVTFAAAAFGAGRLGAFFAVGLTSAADRGGIAAGAVADQAQANGDQHPADALPRPLSLPG